jgi:hypothetical protein
MDCDHCHLPVPDDATIWRVSVGYSLIYYPPAVQSWCAACASQPFHCRRWHLARPCVHCGRTVVFDAARRIPQHAVCGDACRYAVRLAQARARRVCRRQQVACMTCAALFPPKRTDARFCSSICRQRAYRQRQHADAA